MAAAYIPYLARPAEYINPGTPFTIVATAATTFPSGTWANLWSLLHSICAWINNNTAYNVDYRMSDDGYPELTSSTGPHTLTWNDTTLRDLLGFTGASTTIPNGTYVTATYLPGTYCTDEHEDQGPYCWIPSLNSSDRGVYSSQPREVVVGDTSQNGRFSGMHSGVDIDYRSLMFPHEEDTNLLRAVQEVAARDQSLQSFLERCCINWTTDDESASTVGFWYYRNINDCISDCAGVSTTEPWSEATDIGVQFDLSSSPDRKVFCNTSPGQLPSSWGSEPSLLATTLRFHETFGFNTTTAPAWQYVDLSA